MKQSTNQNGITNQMLNDETSIGASPTLSPTEFIAIANQTFEYAFPSVKIVGELSSFRVSKDKWLYFDVKDDKSKVRCFGVVFQVQTALENGMMVEIVAQPKLHNLYGFSLNIKSVRPVGEGSIKKSADILRAKLEKEGLFTVDRKRYVQKAPSRVGLIASEQSAAYADFIKILNSRWQGVEIELYDAQVQGEAAVQSLVSGVSYFNNLSSSPDVIVMTRGGGSIDDLSAFSTEQVTRSIASSRVPTLVAVGHEIDVSLAELAADVRASTPSNAAELLFPDKLEVLSQLQTQRKTIKDLFIQQIDNKFTELEDHRTSLRHMAELVLESKQHDLHHAIKLLNSVHPKATLKRGYALVQSKGKIISSVAHLKKDEKFKLTMQDGDVKAKVQ